MHTAGRGVAAQHVPLARPTPVPRAAFCLVVTLIAWAAPAGAQTDWGSWHSVAVKAVDTATVDVSGFVQIRLYDASTEVRQVYLSGLVAIEAAEHLSLGVNYTYLPTRAAGTRTFRDQHRFEFEVTPRWRPVPRLRLDVRNRLEVRWLEGREDVNQRSRHRTQATLATGRPRATALFLNNEFFYDWDQARFSENRLTPAGVRVAVGRGAELDLYYMVQSTKGQTRWTHAHLLGTHVSVAW